METEQHAAVALVLSCAGLLSGLPQTTNFETLLQSKVFADVAAGLATELGQTSVTCIAAFGSVAAGNTLMKTPLVDLVRDGSARLQSLLGVTQQRVAASQSIEYLCFASACWLRYSMGFDSKGDTIAIDDALAEPLLQNRLERWDHIDELVSGYGAIPGLFPPALASKTRFVDRLSYWLCVILANGMSTALQILALECRDYSGRDYRTFNTAAHHSGTA